MTALAWRAIGWPTELRSLFIPGATTYAVKVCRLVVFLLLACSLTPYLAAQSGPRTIHAFVALADNKNQGIVPVAAILGNGEDPEHNLYWGSAYGVKTYFARSADWQLIASRQKPKPEILERCIFKHRTQNVYLIADAYRGSRIKQAIVDFLEAAAGGEVESVPVKTGEQTLALNARGGADLVAYAGHDGLMDFQLRCASAEQKRQAARSHHSCLHQQVIFLSASARHRRHAPAVDHRADGAGSLHAEERH